jgi:hypothetical protein
VSSLSGALLAACVGQQKEGTGFVLANMWPMRERCAHLLYWPLRHGSELGFQLAHHKQIRRRSGRDENT